ncbi:MAG TPA: phosphoglucosamine mutase [Pseudothermotoga sp.]|nr:phosphoglucosamine mutase [Pseudothermotoga sp.]HOK84111.1 phosphoglucosamine mutase [Pseudothermotoga sp.]HPP69110.1 phosphoglucosamine mutase [Pseudothermotoga sp.]
MRELFGTDGIRGIFNEDLTEELAHKVGLTIGRMHPDGKFLVVRDTRESGLALQSAIADGLVRSGATVYLGGILPTPAAALITKLKNWFGVVISASHNPYYYNGIKLMRSGFKLADEEEAEIEKRLSAQYSSLENHLKGQIVDFPEVEDLYVQMIADMFSDVDFRGISVAVDASNGAAYRTTPAVLDRLGLKVTCYCNQPDGRNINDNCGSLHPEYLAQKIAGFDLGILHDGDADRCILLSKEGKEIHGDKIMGILAVSMKNESRLKNNLLIATIMSNLGLEIFLKENQINMVRTKVGDRYVLEQMLKSGANIGGERSGHIIFLDRSTTGDGLITALEFLRVMVIAKKDSSELEKQVADLPQHMINVKVLDKTVAEHPHLKEKVSQLQRSGFRIVVRASGTEPVIRVMAEGQDALQTKMIAEEIADLVKALGG